MLIMIIQKIHGITLKIKSETKRLRINFSINNQNIKAFLETDIKNAKETKNLFCLKLLFENYPYFCKNLYDCIDKIDNHTIKNQREYIKIGNNQKKNHFDLKNENNEEINHVDLKNRNNEEKNHVNLEDKGILKYYFYDHKIFCHMKGEKINIEKFNRIILNNYDFQKKPFQILKEVFENKLNKKLSQTIKINKNNLTIKGNFEDCEFSYKFILSCTDIEIAKNYIALILIKKFIPNLYKSLSNYYKIKKKFRKIQKNFWKIQKKSEFYEISDIEIIENNLTRRELKNMMQTDFSIIEKIIYENEEDLTIFSKFFKSIGFKFKRSTEVCYEDDSNVLCGFIIHYTIEKDDYYSISIKIKVYNKNEQKSLKISQAKLIDKI